ncbi:Bcr/CflA family multidrug efflux MFS transporter [Alkalicoccobacillus murimartini]|uniref:Bcr/CflA family efflux transporter n=1 Tax=Alkalicoccobacillus murimartini TaxID=171685 RepID=A0ABT9YCA4_9BACI|nr:Bcr/CflA family multidrug efflux MFS transporter [Alkalicoccobacillus murimartini]MDQ0205475.1 DHA1 family bicyclomycin/chloramphenicol resistance-like MFS transporter [Alkalicoccobacillus murimartini]
MVQNPTGKERIALAFLLSMLAVLGPLNIDMYLPSFPDIAEDLGARESLVQLSLTACLFGLAIGQVIVGPISDSKGRLKPLIISVLLFALASLLCALAPNITWLIIGRFLQGLTAAGGVVVSRAIVRDVFSGAELTKFFALLMVINAVAPLVAPIVGGAILWLPFTDWSTIFYFLAFVGLAIVAMVMWKLKESHPPERRTPSSLPFTLKTFGELFRDKSFIGYALTLGFAHGGSFAYVSGTPFVYQGIYGVSPQTFSILFGINGLAIIGGTWLVGRYVGRISEQAFLRSGVILATAATAFLLVMTVLEAPLALIVIPIFIYMTSMGMILTTSYTLGIKKQAHRAGSASALLGLFPLLIGAMVAPLVGLAEASAVPMGIILFSTCLIALGCFYFIAKKGDQEDSMANA